MIYQYRICSTDSNDSIRPLATVTERRPLLLMNYKRVQTCEYKHVSEYCENRIVMFLVLLVLDQIESSNAYSLSNTQH